MKLVFLLGVIWMVIMSWVIWHLRPIDCQDVRPAILCETKSGR